MGAHRTSDPGHLRSSAWSRVASASVRLRADLPLALLDTVVAIAAYGGWLVVRFDGQIPGPFRARFGTVLLVAVAIHLGANWAWGLYGQMWRHASVQEARRIVLAGGSTLVALLSILIPVRAAPLSVVVLGAGTATMISGAVRFQTRLFAFHRGGDPRQDRRVVVIGAGESGALLLRDMLRSPVAGVRPVALLDDDPRKLGRQLHGLRVEGATDRLPQIVRQHGAQEALLAIPSADGELVRAMAQLADQAGVPLKVLPGLGDLVNGHVSLRDVRDLTIDDLLGRSQVRTDLDAVRSILTGRRVLITGAGGSIGSEIARQVAACEPTSLVLLDHDETHLYEAADTVGIDCHQALVDIRDRALVDSVFAQHRPDVVFHAAAHKHVPILEEHPCEALHTNVLGTASVRDAAARHGVDRFVLISTDKAVRPSSVMGASKRVAEQLVLAGGGPPRSCAVRFGNVLGSRGSVVPRFMSQIQRGGPVTVTDARMTRYFMSIPEAVQLVLQAAAFAEGGEIYMLHMGEPVRILDLAERMIRLSGRRVGTDIAIRVTGVRPGEKLSEELHIPEHETPEPTRHPSIVVIRPGAGVTDVDGLLPALRTVADRRDAATARRLLHQLATSGTDDVLLLIDQEEEPAWPASIG